MAKNSGKKGKSSSEESHWHRSQVLCLIKSVEKFYDDFYDSSKKKKAIWQAVAQEMRGEGYNYTGPECDKKWNNLKASYMKVLKKQSHGESSNRFEYFDALHHILGKAVDPMDQQNESAMQCSQVMPESEGIITTSEYKELEVDGDFMWIPSAVNLFLDHVKVALGNISSPATIEERWQEISEKLINESHYVTGEMCQRKWEDMQDSFYYYQTTSQATGSSIDWPYFSRMKDIMIALNIPITVSEQMDLNIDIQPITEKAVQNHERGRIVFRKSPESESQMRSGKSLLTRVRHLESNFSIKRRLDALEERVEQSEIRREVCKQTNTILSQIVSELRKINEIVEAENSKLYRMQQQKQHVQRPDSPNQRIIIVEDFSESL